ncbi:CLUMA_CG006807, isoform A [Clunio marinus]|uniref:CLUMA_CG006807, isoform A n=1 Tax=Clunio marinus TaxID=568069 RepID=A0A1J1HYT4_9DIPT|nr:CLUMA_CG006807, isoform A [Clunio marinus]
MNGSFSLFFLVKLKTVKSKIVKNVHKVEKSCTVIVATHDEVVISLPRLRKIEEEGRESGQQLATKSLSFNRPQLNDLPSNNVQASLTRNFMQNMRQQRMRRKMLIHKLLSEGKLQQTVLKIPLKLTKFYRRDAWKERREARNTTRR